MKEELFIAVAGRKPTKKELGLGKTQVRWETLESSAAAKYLARPLVLARTSAATEADTRRALLHFAASSQDVPLVFWQDDEGSSVPQVVARLLMRLAQARPRSTTRVFLLSKPAAVRRMILARVRGAEAQLIADAELDGDEMVVTSCEPREIRCPVRLIPALARMSAAQLADFEVSASGSCIHWPRADIDLDLDLFRVGTDKDLATAYTRRLRDEMLRMGGAVRAVRESRGLRQQDIPGLTERQVRRLEKEGMRPRLDTIRKLAAAHEMSPEAYLAALAEAQAE